MKVMLVDDEVEFITALAERLRLRGYETSCATTGEEALRLTREKEHDVAILDVKMPGLSGIDLMEQMHALRPALQFIFVTGHGSENDFQECSRKGLCETIIKPIKIEELVKQIEHASRARSRK